MKPKLTAPDEEAIIAAWRAGFKAGDTSFGTLQEYLDGLSRPAPALPKETQTADMSLAQEYALMEVSDKVSADDLFNALVRISGSDINLAHRAIKEAGPMLEDVMDFIQQHRADFPSSSPPQPATPPDTTRREWALRELLRQAEAGRGVQTILFDEVLQYVTGASLSAHPDTQDALRLDWLANPGHSVSWADEKAGALRGLGISSGPLHLGELLVNLKPSLREAIDAAMSVPSGPPTTETP